MSNRTPFSKQVLPDPILTDDIRSRYAHTLQRGIGRGMFAVIFAAGGYLVWYQHSQTEQKRAQLLQQVTSEIFPKKH
jgi:hypothetical protein